MQNQVDRRLSLANHFKSLSRLKNTVEKLLPVSIDF